MKSTIPEPSWELLSGFCRVGNIPTDTLTPSLINYTTQQRPMTLRRRIEKDIFTTKKITV